MALRTRAYINSSSNNVTDAYALIDSAGLIGFRSFGPDGQVPGGEYDSSALDLGGGLRPELTGKGLGRQAIRTGLDFGRQQFAPEAFRVTIATFNIRAQRVVHSLGFRRVGSFRALADNESYESDHSVSVACGRPGTATTLAVVISTSASDRW